MRIAGYAFVASWIAQFVGHGKVSFRGHSSDGGNFSPPQLCGCGSSRFTRYRAGCFDDIIVLTRSIISTPSRPLVRRPRPRPARLALAVARARRLFRLARSPLLPRVPPAAVQASPEQDWNRRRSVSQGARYCSAPEWREEGDVTWSGVAAVEESLPRLRLDSSFLPPVFLECCNPCVTLYGIEGSVKSNKSAGPRHGGRKMRVSSIEHAAGARNGQSDDGTSASKEVFRSQRSTRALV